MAKIATFTTTGDDFEKVQEYCSEWIDEHYHPAQQIKRHAESWWDNTAGRRMYKLTVELHSG